MLHDGKFYIKLGLPSGNAFPTDPAPAEGDVFYREDLNKVFSYDGAAWNPIGLYTDYIHIRDEKASGTHGGDFNQGAWRTRVLNVELSDTGGDAALAANQITLEAGTYRCLISCPANHVDRHKSRLQNITDASTILMGTSEYTPIEHDLVTRSIVVGRFTLAAQKVLEVQHYCQLTFAVSGFGIASAFGVVEVYTEVEFWKEV